MIGEKELRQAINQKCLECSGGMRNEVAHCRLKNCALHPYRPFQRAVVPANRTRGTKQVSVFEMMETMA